MNLGKTPKDWQFRKKFKSNSAFRALIETFPSLLRSEMLRRPSYLAAMLWIMEPKGRDSRKQIVIFKKVTTCINFKDMFRCCQHHRQLQNQRFLRDLKKQGKLENDLYDSVYPNGSQPVRIYGLPKMHKLRDPTSTPPFRPTVSSIGTYNYNLAKLLCNLLEPHILNDYNATDTFTFVQEINNLPMFGKFLISFDVESLFTNIPLKECIDLTVKYISEGNPDLKLTPSDLKRLFTFATAETHFLFKGSFYDQIDGVAMG